MKNNCGRMCSERARSTCYGFVPKCKCLRGRGRGEGDGGLSCGSEKESVTCKVLRHRETRGCCCCCTALATFSSSFGSCILCSVCFHFLSSALLLRISLAHILFVCLFVFSVYPSRPSIFLNYFPFSFLPLFLYHFLLLLYFLLPSCPSITLSVLPQKAPSPSHSLLLHHRPPFSLYSHTLFCS